jgi:hypothetical protein
LPFHPLFRLPSRVTLNRELLKILCPPIPRFVFALSFVIRHLKAVLRLFSLDIFPASSDYAPIHILLLNIDQFADPALAGLIADL